MKTKKLKVAVLYGGRSGEHEISLRSAESVLKNLDPERFDVIPVLVSKDGDWAIDPLSKFKNHFDVVFPVMHGPLCEDGTVQGILETADIPYVGAGVLGSAIGMDKEVAKRLAREAGLPIVPFLSVKSQEWKKNPSKISDQAITNLGLPLFIKPANMGSSVGVHKVKSISQFTQAMQDAFRYDTKVLIEKAIVAREIEVAVLENVNEGEAPIVSVPGEIIPHHEFYSYEAKYIDENGAALKIPTELPPKKSIEAQNLARHVFNALECEGMGRVDLFLDRKTDNFYFNEINTIPGFTSISMYPKLLEASGITYPSLLSALIDLALKRQSRKNKLLRKYSI